MAHETPRLSKVFCEQEFERIITHNNLWEDVVWKLAPDDHIVRSAAMLFDEPYIPEDQLDEVMHMAWWRLTHEYHMPEERHDDTLLFAKQALLKNRNSVRHGRKT